MAHPSELVPAPPDAGLRLGQQPKKGGQKFAEWLDSVRDAAENAEAEEPAAELMAIGHGCGCPAGR